MDYPHIILFGQGNYSLYTIDILMKVYKSHHIKTTLWPTDADIPGFDWGIVAIGDNYNRAKVANEILEKYPDFYFSNALHPSCVIGLKVKYGYGIVAMAGVIINPGAKIGNHTFFATGAQIEHDCIIEDFASVSAGSVLGGHVHLKKYAAVAMGCTIFDRVTIGENSVIGSGSLVTKDVPDNQLWYGSPARFIRERKPGEKWLK